MRDGKDSSTGSTLSACRLVLASVFAVAGSLTLVASPASALIAGHAYSTSFSGSGTNALGTPTGIGLDNSSGTSAGDVYVPDSAKHRVEKFDSAGSFLLMFGKGVNETTGGDICPRPGFPADVCKEGSSGSAAGQFTTPSFIAVDGSSGPSAGDIYVADTGTGIIQKFDPTGALITGWGGTPAGGQQNGSTFVSGPFAPMGGIAVDPSGNLWVFKTSGSRVFELTQAGTSVTTFTAARASAATGFAVDGAGGLFKNNGNGSTEKFTSGGDVGQVTSGPAATGLAIDPNNNDLYVDGGTSVFHYHFTANNEVLLSSGSQCTFASFSGCGETDNFGATHVTGGKGLALNKTSNNVYLADTSNHEIDVFTPILVPATTTGNSSNVGKVSATVAGHVDPDGGGNVTNCHFDYGLGTEYGLSAPCSPGTPYSVPKDVTAALTNLAPETTYHYRVVASNANNVPSNGTDHTFTTLPAVAAVTTGAVSEITQTSAMLHGSFDPAGDNTEYTFEWGPTTAYGNETPEPPEDAGSTAGTHSVSAEITGLTSYTLYHYRIAATSFAGTTYGEDKTFYSEPPFLPAIEGTSASGVTQSAATLSAQINPGFGDTFYLFEYGPSTSYGSLTGIEGSIGSDNVNHTASAALSGLTPGTTYHFRAVAMNFGGTTHGPDRTFNTLDAPQIAGTFSSGVGETTATVGANIRPGFSPTTYHVEYGTSTSYGSSSAGSASIGADNSTHPVSLALAGLAPGTTYHFRIVAANGVGTTSGPDQTFTTLAPPPPPPPPLKCKKGFVKKHGKCVKRKHRKHHRHG